MFLFYNIFMFLFEYLALVSVSEEVRSRCHLKHRTSQYMMKESPSSDSLNTDMAAGDYSLHSHLLQTLKWQIFFSVLNINNLLWSQCGFLKQKKRKNILWSSFRCYLLLIDRCLLLLFFLYHWTYDPSAPLTVSGDGHTRHPDSLLHDPTPCGHTHDSATEELGGSRPRANQCSTTPERSTAHKSTSGWQSWLVTVLKVGCMLYTKKY